MQLPVCLDSKQVSRGLAVLSLRLSSGIASSVLLTSFHDIDARFIGSTECKLLTSVFWLAPPSSFRILSFGRRSVFSLDPFERVGTSVVFEDGSSRRRIGVRLDRLSLAFYARSAVSIPLGSIYVKFIECLGASASGADLLARFHLHSLDQHPRNALRTGVMMVQYLCAR